MSLQPSRRDTFGPPKPGRAISDIAALVRHHGSYLRSLDTGFFDGRFATPQPVGTDGASTLVGGDGEGQDVGAVVGEDGDRLTLASVATQNWSLSYVPIAETLVVRWHPAAGAGVEWKRDEHYTIDDDSNVVTITAAALTAAKAEIGDMFSAQYLRLEGEEDAPTDSVVDALTPRGFSPMESDPGEIALPAGTELGDLIVAVCATARNVTGGTGRAYIDDPRLTQYGHGTWVGIATNLSAVNYVNPFGDRMAGAVGTFDVGVFPSSSGTTGPGPAGVASLAVPTPTATATVMGFIEENPNGFTGSLDGYPSGYVQGTLDSGSTICKAYILYWPPDGTDSPPSGNVDYSCHATAGQAWVDVVALQGEEV